MIRVMAATLLFGVLLLAAVQVPMPGWVTDLQRHVQTALAGAIRDLRAGEAGALAAFLAICAGYGVAHAAGPGHGKILLGGAALASRASMRQMMALALTASMAQALGAILMVTFLYLVLGHVSKGLLDGGTAWLTPVSAVLLGMLGLLLLRRGARQWQGLRHDIAHGPDCGCGHHRLVRDGGDVTGDWRAAALLIGSIALRPCTGALFVLVITKQFGIFAAGMGGVLAMGFGTALVTSGIASGAVALRRGTLDGLLAGQTERRAREVAMAFCLVAGAVLLVAALRMLVRT